MPRQSTEIPRSDALRQLQLSEARPSNARGAPALYAFYVVDVETSDVVRSFGFDIPPQQEEIAEDASADAVALQEGGYWTDERGQYFKMVSLSGTFGFRPSRGRGQAGRTAAIQRSINQLQNTIRQDIARQQAQIPTNERTGYDRQLELTNLIRFYWDQKMIRQLAGRYSFIWANWKTGEVYIAQPLQFRRARSAPSDRFQAKYTLSLRLLAPLGIRSIPRDFLVKPNSRDGVSDWLDRVSKVGNALDAAGKVLRDGAEVVVRLGQEVVNAILTPIEDTVQFIQDMVSFSQTVADFPLEVLRRVHRDCLDVATLLEDIRSAPGSTSRKYEEMFHQYKITARAIAEAYTGIKVVGETKDVNTDAKKALRKYRERWAKRDTTTAWNDGGYGPLRTAQPKRPYQSGDRGTFTAVGARPIPKGARAVTIPARSSIKTLAARFLGSAGRWKEIALLNNLTAPYISPSGDGVTVLRPGQTIKIPALPQDDGRDMNQVFDISEAQRREDAYRYGRDLRIDLESFDLQVDDRGDLATVEGLENLRQAMIIKIHTRPGELRLHPWFGFGVSPGEGVAIDRLSRYHLQVRETLLSDTRVDAIDSLSLEVIGGDTLKIAASLTPKDQDDSLELSARSPLR